jgi:two-component system response regulator GlrR
MKKSDITILIAEDNPYSMLLYEEELTDEGYKIQSAKNGLEALNILGKEKVDLLITDVNMQEMNAIEMIPRVRDKFPNMPIVIISGYYKTLPEELSSRGYEVQLFINKPVDMAFLKEKIPQILQLSS